MTGGDLWPPISHWSPRFLPLVEKYGSETVFAVGEKTIGWPPTIDLSAGRQWISANEFQQIESALVATEKEPRT